MGCYGIFVALLLENANKSKEEIVLPFNQTGNAHQPVFYDDRYLVLMDTHDLEVFAKSNATIGTHHPDLGTAGFLRDNRDSRNGMKIVYLDYNFHTDRIWIQNNYFSKVYKSFFQILDAHDSNFVKHMKSWGDKPFEQYETWEVREGLSYVIDEFLPLSNNGARDLLNVNDPYDVGFYTTVTNLRDNFIQTTTKLLDYCNLSYNLETLEYIKDAWLASQKHLYKDTLIKEYVEKILNNEPYTFKNDLTTTQKLNGEKKDGNNTSKSQ